MSTEAAIQEARIFGRYVIGRDIDDAAAELYARAASVLDYDGSDELVRFALEQPRLLGALDGVLALINPGTLLRRKLLLMAAILEARPDYCDAFLPRERTRRETVELVVSLLWGGLQTLFGRLFLNTRP